MGKRGPKAEAAGVKAVKAAVRSTRTATAPPAESPPSTTAANAVRAAPGWLIGRGLEIWASKAATLTAAKLLTPADELAFARYCRNFGAWLDLREKLDAEGFTYEAESYASSEKTTTLRRLDPRFIVADRLERQLLAAEDRFGLNPSERQRIMVGRSANQNWHGGLFGEDPGKAPADDASASPAQPAKPAVSPIGALLN